MRHHPDRMVRRSLTPSAITTALASQFPIINSYLIFVSMYLQNFFSSLSSVGQLGANSYIITVAFAYIGGVLSQQNQREMALIARLSQGNKTTVVLEGNNFTSATTPKEAADAKRRSFGFEGLHNVSADNDEASDPKTLRSRMRDCEDMGSEVKDDERKALRESARTMSTEQRAVERKVQKKIAEEQEQPVRPRKGKSGKRDWESI